MSNPRKEHWQAVKWVLRYVKGTVNHGLLYNKLKNEGDLLTGFCDSDYCGELDRSRSLTGYCFMLFGNEVSWKASLQTVVALSTIEVEFMAITEAAKEALWLQGLIGEFGVKQVIVPISSNSQSVIHLTKNQGYHEKSKHISSEIWW